MPVIDKKIPELDALTTVDPTQLIPVCDVLDSNIVKKALLSQLLSSITSTEITDSLGYIPIHGTGTIGKLTKWTTGGSVLGDSLMSESGNGVIATAATSGAGGYALKITDNNSSNGVLLVLGWTGGGSGNKYKGIGVDSNGLDFGTINDAATSSITSQFNIASNGNVTVGPIKSTASLGLNSTYSFGWDNGSGTADVLCYRGVANTFQHRNSTNPQTLQVYETYTDASNGSWLEVVTQAGGPHLIRSNANGTGTVRSIKFPGTVICNTIKAGGNDITIDATTDGRILYLSGSGNIYVLSSGTLICNDYISATPRDATLSAIYVTGNSGQTAPLITWRNSALTVLASLNADGSLTTPLISNSTAGIKVGSASTDKVSFFGASVIVQPSGNVLTALSNLGLITNPTLANTDISTAKGVISIYDHIDDVSNTGTTETTLYFDNIGTSRLAVNSDKIIAQYGGIFTGAASATQQLRVYFGPNHTNADTLIFDSGALSITTGSPSWDLYITIIRVSSSVVKVTCSLTSSSAALAGDAQYTPITGLTLTNAQYITLTGTSAGVGGGSSQVTVSEGYGQYAPAA